MQPVATVLETTQLLLTALSGLAIGVGITVIPTGPVNVVCIQRTLERGFWGGFAAGVGAALGDGLIAMLATFGITAISGLMANYSTEIQLIGGAIMIVFGLKLFAAKPKIAVPRNKTNWAELRRIVDIVPEKLRPALRFQIWRILPHSGVIPQTFFLTITNPGAILGLFTILAWVVAVLGGLHNYIQAATLVLSVMAGSMFWWAVLSRLIEKLRGKINEGRLKIVNQVAGIALVAFGGFIFVKLALGLTGHAADASVPTLPLPSIIGRRVDAVIGLPGIT